MFFSWYIASLLLIINSCTSQQLCINYCSFEQDFDANLTLPSNCTFIQRAQCSASLTFDYSNRTIKIVFGSLPDRQQRDKDVYKTDNIAHTVITLDGDSSIQHIIEYYCSTGDRCEYDYVLNQALPLYIHKTCQALRAKLISRLHPDPSSTSRNCVLNNGDVSVCTQPCNFFFVNPNDTLRTCDGRRPLQFETTVGRSTPINNHDYDYRLYAYACTTELCNGYDEQKDIEKLLVSDDGECLIILDDGNQTTTTITPFSTTTESTTSTATGQTTSTVTGSTASTATEPTTSTATEPMTSITVSTTTTATHYNQATSFSKSFFLFIVCFSVLFF